MLFAGALGTLVAGPLADRYGRRRVLTFTFLAALPGRRAVPRRLRLRSASPASRFAGAGVISTFGITIVLSQEYLPTRLSTAAGLSIGLSIGLGGVASFAHRPAGRHDRAGRCALDDPARGAARDRAVRPAAGARARRSVPSGETAARDDALEALAGSHFDLLVVGGGIVGCAVAWLGARAGLRVALVERGDLAGATSSASSKLIHGGLRYLQMGDIGLVREAHAERHALARVVAPHLVRPRAFLVPVYRGGAGARDDAARRARALRRPRPLSPTAAGACCARGRRAALVPPLRTAGLRSAGRYVDHETNDARLTIAVARAAARAGARIATRVEVRALRLTRRPRRRGRMRRRPGRRRLRDARRPASSTRPGPWVDELRRMARSRRAALAALRQGRAPDRAPGRALGSCADDAARGRARAVREPVGGGAARRHDRRAVTRATRASSRSTDADVEQIVRESRASIEPGVVEHDRILSSFAGVRVLPQGEGETPSARRETVFERGGERHALDRRRQVHDVPAHRTRRARAAARRPRSARARAGAGAAAGRRPIRTPSWSGCCATTRRCPRPARATSRASTAATRSSCWRRRATIPRCSSHSHPGAPEVAAQVRWAREREWALDGRRRARPAHDARRARAWTRLRAAASRSSCGERALRRGARPGHDEQPLPAVRRAAGAPSPTAQHEHRQITPRPGWVEHDAGEILARSRDVHRRGARGRRRRGRPTWPRSASPTSARRSCCGSARRGAPARERDRLAGHAQRRARRRRCGDLDRFRAQTGLPLATYFSGPKLTWLLDELPGARARAEAGELAAGTIDSWLGLAAWRACT